MFVIGQDSSCVIGGGAWETWSSARSANETGLREDNEQQRRKTHFPHGVQESLCQLLFALHRKEVREVLH